MQCARFLTFSVALGLLVAVCGPGWTTEFLRGDANGDGAATISDAHRISSFLFRGGWPPECQKTMDSNGDGKVNITDSLWLLNYGFRHGVPMPAPFPEPGEEESPTDLPCDSYLVQPPLEDPVARVTILDAAAVGGEDPLVGITVAISSSRPLGGFSGKLLVDTTVVGTVAGQGSLIRDLGDAQDDFNSVELLSGKVTFGFLPTLTGLDPIPEGNDVEIFEISACLQSGAPPGEYSLALLSAELVDFETGRAIVPEIEGGTLTILETVADGVGCSPGGGPIPGDCMEPVEPVDPGTVNAIFKIRDARAAPGDLVAVPFQILSDAPVQAYSISVNYDEEVLEATAIDILFEKPDRTPYGFVKFEYSNKNTTPGGDGVDEGFIVGAAVFSFLDNCNLMPAGRDNPALSFQFRVLESADVASTEIRFEDGAQGSGSPVKNVLTAYGRAVNPETAESFVLINGLVDVLPEITVFIRGDSNGDKVVDIADPQHTLGHLFVGTERPPCFYASDSNDDGILNIADPIFTLNYLFLGGTVLPQPFPEEGIDLTDDAITCAVGG